VIRGAAYLNHAAHLAPPPGDPTSPPDTPGTWPGVRSWSRARAVACSSACARHARLAVAFVCDALGLDAGVLAAAVRARAAP